MRQVLAQAVNYVGDLTTSKRRKYATPEERKEAAKTKRKQKADLLRQLYKEHQAKAK